MGEPDAGGAEPEVIRTEVCIAGGGPAGVMLGIILARAGIDVVVLEKHVDFLRDFRGDTVHPSTINLLDQLGLRARFEAIPHHPLQKLDAVVNDVRVHAMDFGVLPPPNRFITLMPQWDLLDMLAQAGAEYPSFHLRMGAQVTEVLRWSGRVRGVVAETPGGPLRVDAALVVAADGRNSTVRRALGLRARSFGVPIDVAWFRLPPPQRPLPDTLIWAGENGMLVTFPRVDHLQCGLLIKKGSFAEVRRGGLDAFRARVVGISHPLRPVMGGLTSLDDVKLLSVQIDRLKRWWLPGVLCIGDAAHAMSPAFGVGISYAIQDAVATANELVPVLREGADPRRIDRALAAVARRRRLPTVLMQRVQRAAHAFIATGRSVRVLHNPPTPLERAVMRVVIPTVRPIAARMVGYGFRPERIRD